MEAKLKDFSTRSSLIQLLLIVLIAVAADGEQHLLRMQYLRRTEEFLDPLLLHHASHKKEIGDLVLRIRHRLPDLCIDTGARNQTVSSAYQSSSSENLTVFLILEEHTGGLFQALVIHSLHKEKKRPALLKCASKPRDRRKIRNSHPSADKTAVYIRLDRIRQNQIRLILLHQKLIGVHQRKILRRIHPAPVNRRMLNDHALFCQELRLHRVRETCHHTIFLQELLHQLVPEIVESSGGICKNHYRLFCRSTSAHGFRLHSASSPSFRMAISLYFIMTTPLS